jgi:hypothetical protein
MLEASAPLGGIDLSALTGGQGNRIDRILSANAGQDLRLRTATGPTTVGGPLSAGQALVLRSAGALAVEATTISARGLQLAAGSLAPAMDFNPPAAAGAGAGDLILAGTSIRTGTGSFYASGVMRLSNVTAVVDLGQRLPGDARTGLLFSARGPGGITIPDRLTVATTTPGAGLPPVLLDTRASLAAADPLTLVWADVPGRQPELQPTQVRSPAPGGNRPGAFGPSSNAAAGPITINLLDAGASPVFLLLNGGDARGTLLAGRLGVQGTGGSATLTGSLNGNAGTGAAAFGDVTRPIAPEDLGEYRINGCVLASINCVVTPTFQPLPPWRFLDIEITVRSAGVDPAEVTIPNVGEYDYE